MKNIVLILSLFVSQSSLAETISISMVGDIGFNESAQPPREDYVQTNEGRFQWRQLTEKIKDYLSGDLLFGNIETVVSERNLSSPKKGGFKFISHPNGIEHLVTDLGFNLFSAANNHSADYGRSGLEDTYAWMRYFQDRSGIAFHGVGNRDEVINPTVFTVKGKTIAFSAIGINAFGSSVAPKDNQQIGSLNYREGSHLNALIKAMANTRADIKIVSIHYGTEKYVELDSGQARSYRRIIDEGGVNLIIGHHPHVVRPIEKYNGGLIVYSLGNFLLLGAANIDGRPFGKDYGLIATATFDVGASTQLMSVEAQPIKGMHLKPRALGPKDSAARIKYLNKLSANQVGNSGLQFMMDGGKGVWGQWIQ